MQVIYRQSKVVGKEVTSSTMKFSNRYRLLLKHLDKPHCFLEDKLFRECVSNFQSPNLTSRKFGSSLNEAAEELRVSVLENAYLKPVQPVPSLDHGW